MIRRPPRSTLFPSRPSPDLDLYRRYFEIWYEAGGDLFLPFVAAGSWGKYGSWGALEYVHQDPATSPKYQALLEAAARFGRKRRECCRPRDGAKFAAARATTDK